MPFHIEISRSFRRARAFNLSEQKLRRSVIEPWSRGIPIPLGDREWEPRQSDLKVLEGPQLTASDLAMSQGWVNAERSAHDVTSRFLGARLPETAAVTVGDQVLGYNRVGSGEPLIVLNGYAATKADWDPTFIEALTGSRSLIVLDSRGMGESSGPATDFTVSDLAEDVAGVMDALAIERADVLGWSMGGFVALSLAHSHPQRIGRLVLLGTTAGGREMVSSSSQVHAQLRDLSGSPREQASRLISLLFTPERAVAIDEQFGDLVAEARAALDQDVVRRQIAILDDWEQHGFDGSLSDISHPTLVAAGVEDVVFPVANSVRLAGSIPGAWLAQFQGAGHALMADHPEPLAELIATFAKAT